MIGLVALASACTGGGGGGEGSEASTSAVSEEWDPVAGSVLLLPRPDDAPRIISLARRYDQSSSRTVYALALVDGRDGTTAWTTPGLGDEAYRVPLAVDGERVYTSVDAQVRAFSLDDGAAEWVRDLPDVVEPSCDRCIMAFPETVVVLTYDGYLHGLVPSTGEVRWQRRLEDPFAAAHAVGDRLVVLDQSEAGDRRVFLVSPDDGRTVDQLDATCDAAGVSGMAPGSDAVVLGDASRPDVVDLGFGYSPTCWQRWDLTSSSLVWQAITEGSSPSADALTVVSAGAVLYPGSDGVVVVDTTDGAATAIPDPLDLELVPIGRSGDTVVARGRSTRGTTRYRLSGVDTASGRVRWEHPLGEATPGEGADADQSSLTGDAARFLARVDGDRVHLVEVESRSVSGGTSYELVLDALDAATGASSEPTRVTMGQLASSLSVSSAGWSGAYLVLDLGDRLVVVDVLGRAVTSMGL